jgi:hypothetical protein
MCGSLVWSIAGFYISMASSLLLKSPAIYYPWEALPVRNTAHILSSSPLDSKPLQDISFLGFLMEVFPSCTEMFNPF